ncbi:MAG: ATPase [Lachnospiraceae bacterium]|nr:ATPase [Lachnospiraceae bacterium]
MKEISVKELEREDKDSYILVDIRDEGSVLYGMMPNAISIPTEQFENNMEEVSLKLSKDKKIIVYCQRGENSIKIAERLNDFGFDTYNLKGGFNSFLLESLSKEEESEEYKKSVEESIRKKFHKSIFSPFAKGCKNYELIQEGDHIAVCISGGKDSMLMAKLFQEIQKHKKVSFDLTFLVMDPGYNEQNRALIESNAKKLGIPITIFESDIFDAVDTVEKSPCYLCARMRRGYLYSKAKELGCNKIALGHHYDDVIETILMAMLHGGQIQTMMPKLHSTNFEGMELIRPLYLVREENICKWRDYNNLHFLQCACHFTETCSTCHEDGTTSSKRLETKKLIAKLKENNPYIEGNIFKSVENVNLSTVIAYKKDGVKHNFLEEY